jgi:8-oxo-dGTP pyrophosphatase MutT (NUDIX family)
MIEKVTLFITRETAGGVELLILRHPYAGNQLPAGTVEAGESPGSAARREGHEETGLSDLVNWRLVGEEATILPAGEAVLKKPAVAYARPDESSFDWIRLPRAAHVQVLRRKEGFTQVKYVEPDRLPDPAYASMIVQGWVADRVLTRRQKRYFFQAECVTETPGRWTTNTDRHQFTLFWAALTSLPSLMPYFARHLALYGPGRQNDSDG